MTWGRDDGLVVADPEQLVLEADPPRRLSYTWHTFTPEWAASYGVDEERRAQIATEPRSRVTFELEPDGPVVKLTVVHDGFGPGSTVLQMISGGWPRVVGALKTLLEAGGTPDDGHVARAVSAAPAPAVFDALTTLEGVAGWWMPDVVGSARPGSELTLRFDGEHVTMRAVYADPPGLVVWECVESTRFAEWVGTSVWFTLTPRDGAGTDIELRHVGLRPTCACFSICAPGWDHYVASLAAFAQAGAGQPRGSAEWAAHRGAPAGATS
jgi:uncharacterized protein YndB with AHSA1/START domain